MAAGAADRRGAAAAPPPGAVARRLAEFAAHARPGAAALEAQRLSLLDWAACAIAGAAEPVARILRAQAEAEGGAAQASMAGAGLLRVPARAAALVNGAASHALDYDDTHFAHVGHPSVAVLPAALAVAERQDADGAAFLTAALVGAEASIRFGAWLGEAHAAAGFHVTATAGAFGATLAAARLQGLAPEVTAQALGLVATRASGLRAQFGTMGKPYNAGIAAANGVEAADLAAAGFVSDPAAIEGPQGFAGAHAAEGRAAALDALGYTWAMAGIAHKRHACCHGLHAMLEALGALHLDAASIDQVSVRTHPRWLPVCAKPAPRSGLEAKFSFAMAAALALSGRDTAAPGTFSDAACVEPALVALRAKVAVIADPRLSPWEAVVDVTAAGGRAHRVAHDLARPDAAERAPERARARLEAKVRALVRPERAAALAEATTGPAPDVAALAALLRAAPA